MNARHRGNGGPRGDGRRSVGRVCRAVAACLLFAIPASGQRFWSFEAAEGVVDNLPTRLEISQSGEPEIRLTAHYSSRPLQVPVYYALRVGRWVQERAWEVEFIHHKLYLDNPPAEVHDFSITHGYNVLLVNRAWDRRGLLLRAGGGIVIAHPESMVRGRRLPEGGGGLGGGYDLAGPVLQGSLGTRLSLGRQVFLGLEGKATYAEGEVRVAGGHARVRNAALHLLVGLGARTRAAAPSHR